jgi:hypothetical protein
MKQKHIIRIQGKCSDLFAAQLIRVIPADPNQGMGEKKIQVGEYDGYVPDWFPNSTVEHFGDYVEMDIDVETGKILNWVKPTMAALRKTFPIKRVDNS